MILAQGLGLLKIITNLLHTYDAAGNNLVILVGATDRENEWIGEGWFDFRNWYSKSIFVTSMLTGDSTGGTLCCQ